MRIPTSCNTVKSLVSTFRRHINREYEYYLKNNKKYEMFSIKSGYNTLSSYDGSDWKQWIPQLDKLELDTLDKINKVKKEENTECNNNENTNTKESTKFLNYYKIKLPYTNNDDIFDCYLIKWNPYAETYLHGHSMYGCLSKILEGELQELTFNNQAQLKQQHNVFGPNIHLEDEVSYIDDKIGRHIIKNPSSNQTAYSLHIYGFPQILREYKYVK